MRTTVAIGACCLLALTGTAAAQSPAASTLEECDARVRDDPENLDSYSCYWFVARNRGQHGEAAERLESMLGSDPDNPRIQLYLGVVLADMGQDRAEDLCREAAEGFVAEGGARGEVYSRITLSMFYRYRGRGAESMDQLERALERATAAGDPELETQVRVNLGWQKYNAREYGQAWDELKRAEERIFPDGSIRLRLDALDALGAVSWALGRNRDALDYYRRMTELMQGSDPYRESGIRKNMALVATPLAATGQITDDELIRLRREALAAALRGRNRFAEVGARLMLATELDDEEGLEQAQEALDVARAVGKVGDACWALWLIGEKTYKLNPEQPDRAFGFLEEALELARDRGDAESLARGLIVRARLRSKTGPRERAVEETLAALDAVERIRDLQPEGEVRARVFGRFADDYRRSANGFLGDPDHSPARDDIERAFRVMERMRARTLLETLDAAGATAGLLPTSPLSEERSRVLQQAAAIRNQLGSGDLPPAERERLRTAMDELESREASTREALSREDRAFAALRGRVTLALRDVQDSLRPDQAMLAFQVQESVRDRDEPSYSGGWVTVITRVDVGAFPIADSHELRQRIRLFLALLERRDGTERRGAAQLSDDLLARALAFIPDETTSLIVIPDGPLHRLPFEALVEPGSSSPLAERYEISAAPSAATWLRLRRDRDAGARSRLLSLADPARRTNDRNDAGLGPLPHARREAAALLRNLGGDGRVLIGAEATETAIKSAGGDTYDVIHLAAHALVNDEHPERSAVLFATQTDSDGDDGRLEFGEVVELDLDGQLVLLSACRSASGPLIGGEGLVGLSSAFFQAGARVVVAGLWRVRDRETASLIDRFGRHLATGNSVATSMALAKRDLIRRGAPPAAWAGMVVLGDGDLDPFAGHPGRSRSRSRGSTFVATLMVVAISVILLGRVRLRRRLAGR